MIYSQSIRDAFGISLVQEAKKNKNILAISCDLKNACKLNYFFKKYPKRSFEIGIAEANAIGIAAGLSMDGFRPFVASFGSFITGKNIEIRTSISYNKAPVVIVGTHAGLIGSDGATQSALQDIAVMRSIPNIEVFQPCSPYDTKQILKYVCRTRKPTYLRIARNEIKEFLDKKHFFKVGMVNEIVKGSNILVISSGPMVRNCLDAIKRINTKNGLLNISSLKPLNEKLLIRIIQKYKKILTVEDHSIFGGLGSIVSEIVTKYNLKKQVKIHGINDTYINSDTPGNLEKQYRLNSDGIKKIIQNYKY